MKKINEICDVLNGYAFKSKHYVDSGIRVIRIANVQNGYISDENPCFYPNSSIDDIEKYILKENDLLISLTGNVGRVALLNKEYLPAALNQRVACIRIKDSGVNMKYLFYYLNQRKFIDECIKASKGVAQLNLSTKWLENYQLNIPLIEEQERIVAKIEELFSDLDNAVETLNATKAQLAVYRQSVLKEAFDIDRFPKVKMENIVDDIKIGPFGTMLHKEDYIVGGVPVINPQHIKCQRINPSKKVTISEQKAHELSSYCLQKNDIIMGRRGEMGRTAPISSIENGWICGTGSIIFRLKPEFDALFYSKILSSPNIIAYLEKSATGTTMKNLNEKIVKHIPVPMITREKQLELTSFLEDRLSICENIEKTVDSVLQQASAMRQSILKQAFEGRLL